MTSIPHFVYELVDPRDMSIFYVGITVDLYARFKQHMCCNETNAQKDQRIQEVLTAGHLPIMRTLERTESFCHARQQEDFWIQHYTERGISLLNARDFRTGGRRSDYEKVKKVILYRHFHKEYPLGLSNDMQRWYEFNYFTKPKRAEMVNPRKYAQHVKSYERRKIWIAELFEGDKQASQAV